MDSHEYDSIFPMASSEELIEMSIEIANRFINGVRKAGLQSIGHGRAVMNAEKRMKKGTK